MSHATIERSGISERARQNSYLDLNDPNVTVSPIYLKGLEIGSKRSISQNKKATIEDAISCSYGFVSLSAVHADGIGEVGELSFGVPWGKDRSTFTPIAERMATLMADGFEGAQLEWIGGQHIDVYIESTLGPEEFIRRLVEAPVAAYHDQPHLLEAFTTAQRLRAVNLLGPNGKGKIFTDIVNGRRHGLIRGYQPEGDNTIEDKSEEGRMSFVWNYESVDGELIGLDPVKSEQYSLTDLAKPSKTVTLEMSQGLLKKQRLLSGVKEGVNRYLFSIYWDPSVDCCRTATNAQYFKTDEMIESSNIIQSDGSKLFPTIAFWSNDNRIKPDEEKKWCNEHGKKKTECDCKNENDNQGNKESKKSN